mgnify:CR=1 FL=1
MSECDEPTVGSSWIQFDLRSYVVALLFVIFDVEMVFFFPWAVVYGKMNGLSNPTLTTEQRAEVTQALIPGAPADAVVTASNANTMAWFGFADFLFSFAVLMVGFAYLWRRGDLSWVRSVAAEESPQEAVASMGPVPTPPTITVPTEAATAAH